MTPTLLIDGRSGSGKTELATLLARDTGAQLIRMDAIYPGWGGLAEGSALVTELLTTGRWRRWDWALSQPAEWHEVDLTRPLIVEGCGALTAANRALASHGIWITLDAATRKQRALARDGDTYAPHWDEWAAQEEAFIMRENPALLADEIIDGANGANGADAVAVAAQLIAPATSTRPDPLVRWRALLDPARVEE